MMVSMVPVITTSLQRSSDVESLTRESSAPGHFYSEYREPELGSLVLLLIGLCRLLSRTPLVLSYRALWTSPLKIHFYF